MIPEIGQFALILAFVTAIYQFSVPMYGAWRGDSRLMAVAPPAALLQFGLIALSFSCMNKSNNPSDFSVQKVFHNYKTYKPLKYKIYGVWGKN
jgi:cytochrome c-type biogenesis protein CcmF